MSDFEENQNQKIVFEGEKPSLKGGLRCSRCHSTLVPIDEITFHPSSLKDELTRRGFTHCCVECGVAYQREETSEIEETETEQEYFCEECNEELVKLTSHGNCVGYYCLRCKLLYNESDFTKERD